MHSYYMDDHQQDIHFIVLYFFYNFSFCGIKREKIKLCDSAELCLLRCTV